MARLLIEAVTTVKGAGLVLKPSYVMIAEYHGHWIGRI